MPSQSSNMTALRGAYQNKLYMSVMAGDMIHSRTVTATPPDGWRTIDSAAPATGDYTLMRAGMRMVVRSSTGAYKGTLVLNSNTFVDLNANWVREFSMGQVQVETGDILEIYDDFVLADRLVAANETFAPNNDVYTDETDDWRPIACSGGYWAGWLDQTPVTFDGSDSAATDPDSVSALTHAWTASGGTWDDDEAESPTLTVAAAGKYLIEHTVTDPDNGTSSTQFVRARVHDENDPPYELYSVNIDGDETAGFRVSLSAADNLDLDLDAIPDGAWVVIWSEEWHNGTRVSYGAKVSGRSHIVCTGILRRDTSRASGDTGAQEIDFEVISPLARLAELPGFSKVILADENPDAWSEARQLSVGRAIFMLLRYYTNALLMCDYVVDGFDDALYAAFFLQKNNPYEQVMELAKGRLGRLTCDRTGRLELQGQLYAVPIASRAAIAKTVTLTDDDVLDYELRREHWRTLETFRARGFSPGLTANNPLFARFPATPGTGNSSPVIEKLISDDIFADCSLLAAWEDRVYFDADGTQYHAPELNLTLDGNYGNLWQFYREYVAFAGGSLENLRGVAVSDFLWIPMSVSVTYDGGSAETRLTLRAATYAPPAASVDDTPPASTAVPYTPDYNYPPITIPSIDLDIAGLNAAANRIAAFNTDGYVYITSNFRSASPTWTRYALGLTGTLRSFAWNPHVSATTDGFIATSSRLYKIEDIASARTATDLHTLANSVDTVFVETSISAPGWVMAVYYNDSNGTHAAYSTDSGATVSEATVSGQVGNASGDIIQSYMSVNASGTAWVMAHSASITTAVYKTTDYGANWSQNNPAGFVSGTAICPLIFPWHNNASESILYFGRITTDSSQIYRTTGSSANNLTTTISGANVGLRAQRSVAPCLTNRSIVAAKLNGAGTNGSLSGIYTSSDEGATWTKRTSGTSTNYSSLHIPDNPLVLFLWGASGAIGYSSDGGATIQDKRGNIASMSSPSPGTFVNIVGLG